MKTMKRKTTTHKNSIKRAKFRLKERKKHDEINHTIERHTRMTKTHSNGLADAGKKTARWLRERLNSNAPAPTTLDIMTRVRAQFPSPTFDTSDQIGIGRAALAILKRDDPEGWQKYIEQRPDIQDRAAAGAEQ